MTIHEIEAAPSDDMYDCVTRGRAWARAHPQRAIELNDMLDALPDLRAQRVLYATFTKEEQNGLMEERLARQYDRRAPTGSLVWGVRVHRDERYFSFSQHTPGGGVMRSSHDGLALVVGAPERGGPRRCVMLIPPWQNQEGRTVLFAETWLTEVDIVP